MSNRTWCMVAVAAVWAVAGAAWAADPGGYEHPTWRIPRLAKPPTIDGVVNPDEYAQCPAITGMVTWNGGQDKTLVPKVQDVTWYLGYDDKYLYIAMSSPQPPGTWPKARCKANDSDAVLWDDHVEIQIATRGRRTIASPGKGFYKIMANPRGFFRDEWYYNGTPGTEVLWSMAGPVKCSVTPTHWDLEMAVSLEALREKNIDGKSFVLQLLRADAPGGIYFAGWVGETWMAWNTFGEVIFDPNAPAFRFLETGDLVKGDLGLKFEVVGTGKSPQTVDILTEVTDGAGKSIYRKTQQAVAGPGEVKPVAFIQAGVPLTDRGNVLHILATTPDPDAGGARLHMPPPPLFEVKIPIVKLTEKYQKEMIDPWLAARPRTGDFDWKFFYWPSYGVAESRVDVDFFGMKEDIATAKAFQVNISDQAGKALASQKADLVDKTGKLAVETGKLPAGKYTAKLQLIGADGKTVVATKEQAFVRQTYPWEGNNLGRDDIIVPPYAPLRVKDNVVSPVLRDYTIGQSALPAQIAADGGKQKEDILRGPIALQGAAGGKDLTVEGAKLTMGAASDTRVKVEASGKIGPAAVAIAGEMEYDGWYDVKVKISAAEPNAVLERLTLVIPLWKGADTMYVQRGSDGLSGTNCIGDIPTGNPADGVLWDSAKLLPCAGWGSFVPIVYAGNGDKGLWWFAEEDRDWTLSDKLPAVQYVRVKDGVDLRINILAGPTSLAKERVIHFALIADPVKKMANERKIGWGWHGSYTAGLYAHCTFGWREWGRSDDGYYMLDEDRAGLRRLLYGQAAPQDNNARHVAGAQGPAAIAGAPVTLYGSTSNMTWDLPEFDTYQGEWIRYTTVPPMDKLAPKPGGWNLGHTHQRTTSRSQGEQGINFVASQQDCFVWYHKLLLEQVPVNGTWWDNGSCNVINDYDPARKEFFDRWNVFVRRDLCKRLNVVGFNVGRVPWWINNMHVDWMFNQVSWHIENDFYVDDPTNTLLDQMSMGQFRGGCRIKRGIIHRLASRYGGGSGPSTAEETRRRARNTVGLCLLHDIGAYLWGDYHAEYQTLPALLDKYVGFFEENDRCKFTGYWANHDLVRIGDPKVYASVYQGQGRAVLVVVNGSKDPVNVPFELTRNLLIGREPARVLDAETGVVLQRFYNVKTHGYDWGEYVANQFPIEGHGLRIFVVE